MKLNKYDKMVVELVIQEALKLGIDEKDFVQFKLGDKVFKIVRMITPDKK